ncbi:ferritin-like domain-containing protein [Kribbella steppae]|uniref:ferritin-like domain-containing protein n=1 Tax=Kribbella steppae TaxID=2512223 RepID=UPI001F53F8C1|nr:ferritin-like protein [Kribbella steppae]
MTWTLESLREHLQWAVELEHATLPPYLCALYSLDPQRNPEAVQVVGSVFSEEMLHLALAANILNAVGGRPHLDKPEMLPPHPRRMPHGDRSLELSLAPFGPEALEMFLRIERPAPPGGAAEGDNYETIGQFYDAIEHALRSLCSSLGEEAVFCGDPARQVSNAHFRLSGGRLVVVDSLKSALEALEEIVEQGEGTSARRGLGRGRGHVPPGPRRGRPLLPFPGTQARPPVPARRHPGLRPDRRGDRLRRGRRTPDAAEPAPDRPS